MSRPTGRDEEFRHEAFMYAGEAEFVAGTVSFIRGGLAAGEPVLVVVSGPKIRRLRAALGADADSVAFADMATVGHNPGRIIAAWSDFVAEHTAGGRRLRGIGEPIGPERSPAELIECHRHESLLNVAFAGSPAWWLLCPYDTEALAPSVVEEARRTHPFVHDGGTARPSDAYRGLDHTLVFDDPLPPPPEQAAAFEFRADTLREVRRRVAWWAQRAGFGAERTADLLVAVNEIATNSLRHGGGRGTVRMWQEGATLLCDVQDSGRITEPLVGRLQPALDRQNGRGLWLANQVCDLVQLHSSPAGTIVRLHMRVA